MSAPQLIAYRTGPSDIAIEPAHRGRAWMDATHQQFAKRCLPLMIGNQAGWWLLNPVPFSLKWNGGRQKTSIEIQATAKPIALSHFGHGIITFQIPYLFRTSEHWHLWAKGPANMPKQGIAPLEGITETDWSVATFTMNYQVTTPRMWIPFAAGEPFCHIVPLRSIELETFAPEIRPMESNPDLHVEYMSWKQSRDQHNSDLRRPDSDAVKSGWQKHYVRGISPAGSSAPPALHRTTLKLRPFVEVD